MEKLTNSLQDTSIYLSKQEETIDSSIRTLVEHEDRLRAYMILYMLASKSQEALNKMKDEMPNIEKRFLKDSEDVCKQAEEILSGLKTHLDWVKDVMDALCDMCKDTDLVTRNTELHNQIVDMEKSLSILIDKRNNIPVNQLGYNQ